MDGTHFQARGAEQLASFVAEELAAGGVPFIDANSPTADDALPQISLFIAGDSTVMTYKEDAAPMQGWGQQIASFLRDEVTVNNQALGGRSTRTFVYGNVTCDDGRVAYNGGTPDKSGTRWERIEQQISAGDFCLIQFGHNDAGSVCERHVEVPEYQQNLQAMVRAVRARGATPILITPMSQLSYRNGVFTATLQSYATAMLEVGRDEQVETVDLNTLSVDLYQRLGYDTVSSQLFMPAETTHFQREGAIAMARLVSEALAAAGGPLAPYVTLD